MVVAYGGSALLSSLRLVVPSDLALLFAFGALNLGLGLSLFVIGAQLIPAALGALVASIKPVFGPLWVWLVHGEVPGGHTLVGGGAMVIAALLAHLTYHWSAQQQR